MVVPTKLIFFELTSFPLLAKVYLGYYSIDFFEIDLVGLSIPWKTALDESSDNLDGAIFSIFDYAF